jgi:pyridoxamine 5'-phosphate oxidase
MDKFYELRRSYSLHGLEDNDLVGDPVTEFRRWLQIAISEAPEWLEATAMTLATSDMQGAVSARIVLLKSLENDEFQFFTSYESRKGQQLAGNPHAALIFFWPHLERQVRIEGTVTRTTRAVSEAYFSSRPRGSQIGAAISRQSRNIASRSELESRATELEKQLAGAAVPCPETWGGYALLPRRIEFWQGRLNRLHDRILFERVENGSWARSRLAP